MIAVEPLRWALTVAFAATAGFHLVRVLRPAAPAERLTEALHLVMGASMITMIWPWGGILPAPAWIAIFVPATGWFVARAARSAGQRVAPMFFASATAAMVWMSAAMPAGTHHDHGYAAWVSAGLGAYLVAAALCWVIRGMRLRRLATASTDQPPPSWAALCHGTMSAGMGLALLAAA
ncbi:DUF5134 domain-containing protein [Paractinoplanes rishiriensis]|uniref:DUF5134 domain-containing protein n=1 Tax=Paractinoplanes rishiriensis TaxID=1050105 RepID=A0A919JY15_9ACTN|nr:DUF5134 domain-containing protein [Actinoplanes rishiriensis]GIE95329.1 hypothetical protein Ari01nite_27940 [Actinoplanes rishiriensis]